MPLGMEVGLSPGDLVVLDGDPSPSLKGGQNPSPIFGPFLLWPNGWMHQDITCYGARPHPRGPCVRWGQSPLTQKGGGAPLIFSAHVYCGKTAGWIKMALGMEAGLGPGYIVLGNQLPSPKRGQTLNFRSIFIVAKRLGESRWHLAWRWALVQTTLC